MTTGRGLLDEEVLTTGEELYFFIFLFFLLASPFSSSRLVLGLCVKGEELYFVFRRRLSTRLVIGLYVPDLASWSEGEQLSLGSVAD